MAQRFSPILVVSLACGAWLGGVQTVWGAPAVAKAPDFVREVQPILARACFGCHGTQKRKGGLRLDVRRAALEASDGKVIVPGHPAKSLLLERVLSTDPDERMPPPGETDAPPLPAADVAALRAWIAAGASWPELSATGPAPESLDHLVSPEEKSFWSFKPLAQVAVPEVEGDTWSRNGVDGFVLARLRKEGLQPAPPATRRELVRRVTFDLIGLPPTPAEVEAFVRDERPDAYERLVDRLLADPRHGERWAQHWLDLVRYAETEGFEYDQLVPSLWRYRDYVIQALNQDMPFDRFVFEQLAGDEADPGNRRLQIAAGFHRLAAVRRNAGNQAITSSRNEVLTERTDIIGTTFLGLTIGCARCHDHKFDPIRQRDYYHLQAFVAATHSEDEPLVARDEYEAWKRATDAEYAELSRLEKALSGAKGAASERLREQIRVIEERLPTSPPVIATVIDGEATPIHILKRGDPDKKGPQVGMAGPAVLQWDERARPLPPDTAKPRVALARWLMDKRQPLSARVTANRLWAHHFGRGLVATLSDFGANGSRPSHPELLDYLAGELIRGGWRMKAVHRLMVLSATYRQSSRAGSDEAARAQRLDPQNTLLWKWSRRRLSAEELRDAMLAVAGVLNPRMGGPSVVVPVDGELVRQLYKPGQWRVTPDAREHDRRSIYLLAKRNLRLPMLEVFDQPNGVTTCAIRAQSTHAPQALELLNGDLTNRLAPLLARRLAREAGRTKESQVERGFALVAGRAPTPEERRMAIEFLARQPLDELALALFNLNGFLYVD